MHGVYDWFSWLNDQGWINLSIIYDGFDRRRFIGGLLMTLRLSGLSIALSLLLGIAGAWLQGAQWRGVRWAVHGYVTAFRNTPPLIQLYFFFFGVGALLPQLGGHVVVDAVSWAVIALALGAGAMNVEIFRSGIEAVPRTTLEAAEALGYGRLGAFIHVVLPLAMRVCLPALTNNLVNLVKTTTLAYAIAVPELLYVSAQIWSEQLNVREMMVVLLFAYLIIVGVVVVAMGGVERALRLPGQGKP